MPWATLRKILFLCCGESDEIQDPYNESSHLIPAESVESSSVIYSNVVLRNHQLQERLGLIVRTKEGKMVNVASTIPFNLHNKILSSKRSRSASGSIDHHPRDHDYQSEYGYSSHRQPNLYPYDGQVGGSRSASPYAGPTVGHSQTLDKPMPTPLLNVRLVGYTDDMTKSRGRARERRCHSMAGDEGVASAAENAETSCEGLIASSSFKLRDVGSMTLNWND